MLAQLPPEISGIFTQKTMAYAMAGWFILQNLGRVYQALRSGGGLVSIWRGLIYGTNVPTDKQIQTNPQTNTTSK